MLHTMEPNKACTDPILTKFASPAPPDYALHISSDLMDHSTNGGIRSGVWETKLFCCLGTNFGAVLNAFMGWCLPCVTIAQLSQRLGFVNYWLVLLLVVVLIAAERLVVNRSEWEEHSTSYLWLVTKPTINGVSTAATDGELHVENIYLLDTGLAIYIFQGMWAFVGVVPGFVMALGTWALRIKMRSRFNIPGSCCMDCVAAFFCSCCAVAQMASHVEIPNPRGCNVGPVDTLPAFPQQ